MIILIEPKARAPISVVIPTFQRPSELEELLQSILLQTLPPNEVIVIDDCSSEQDKYEKLNKFYSNQIHGFQFHRMKINIGASACRNYGIKLCQNPWIAFTDDDDLWLPRKLEAQWAVLRDASPDLGLLHTWANVMRGPQVIDTHSFRARPEYQGIKFALRQNLVCSPTVVVRADALHQIGGFDPEMPSCQDWDTWLLLLEAGYRFDVVQEVLAIYRKHEKPSIGLSPKARVGYRRFHIKHLKSALKEADFRFLARTARLLLQ